MAGQGGHRMRMYVKNAEYFQIIMINITQNSFHIGPMSGNNIHHQRIMNWEIVILELVLFLIDQSLLHSDWMDKQDVARLHPHEDLDNALILQ